MFRKKTEKAFADWPETAMAKDGRGILLTGRYVPPQLPGRTWWVAVFAFFPFLYLFMVLGGSVVTDDIRENYPVVLILIPLASSFASYLLHHWLMKVFARRLRVKITPRTVEIGRKVYERAMEPEFSVEHHHKAINEAHREQNSGQAGPSTYRRALEVIMHYGEKRVVIAEMRETDAEMASALVIRLQNICNQVDEVMDQLQAAKEQREAPARGAFGPEQQVR